MKYEIKAENKSGAKLMLVGYRAGAYGMDSKIAVVKHNKYGLILIQQGFGGSEIEGLCYRWKHGRAHKITKIDIDSIEKMYSDECNFMQHVDIDLLACVIESPYLEKLAESLGI